MIWRDHAGSQKAHAIVGSNRRAVGHSRALVPERKRSRKKTYRRKPGGGRKPLEPWQVFEGIVFVLRTGIQWKALPKTFGASSSVHSYFQDWRKAGFFKALWAHGVALYDEQKGIGWRWQAIDGAKIKAPMGEDGVGRNPTDGGKSGTGRHLLVDEKGVPLGIVLVGANRHDVSQLGAVLGSKIACQPDTVKAVVENLRADAGYVGEKAEAIIRYHRYIPHVRPRGEEITAKKNKRFKPRRWIVEVSHSWFNNFRKLKVRYEKTTANVLALHHLAAATIALRRCRSKTRKNIIYG